ncbi:MAG: coproporphyrinogen III oxidase family protein [bacterium]|nr:MAG: coproporphyrinogen III oxidase family protein [bacterium]
MIYLPEPLAGCAVYIHIPFCANLCPYCHFYRRAPDDGMGRNYLKALVSEMDSLAGVLSACAVRTVYVGGGTPTLMPPSFYRSLFEEMGRRSDMGGLIEATLETDGRISEDALRGYAGAGFNRISIGVKALSPFHRRVLGVDPGIESITGFVSRAREAGFSSVSCDLMYGFEGQRREDLLVDLQALAVAGADHLSLYALEQREHAGPREDHGDETARMYRVLRRRLIAEGYRQYEISNFSREGHECLHNLNYWCDGDYIGLGPSAHSAMSGGGIRKRWCNPADLDAYIADPAACRLDLSSQGPEAAPREALMMALRLTQGVNSHKFTARYGVAPTTVLGPALREFEDCGLIKTSQGRIRLTTRGILLSNELFVRLL